MGTRDNAWAMSKIHSEENKVKQVLLSNNGMHIYIHALYNHTPYRDHANCAIFEEISHNLFTRTIKSTIEGLNKLNTFELINLRMCIPRAQEEVNKILGRNGGSYLSMHTNLDKLVVLGIEQHRMYSQEASVSTTLWVRYMAMAEVRSFLISDMIKYIENIEEEENEGLGLDSPR